MPTDTKVARMESSSPVSPAEVDAICPASTKTTPTLKKAKTTFLTLPRELRQKILYQSHAVKATFQPSIAPFLWFSLPLKVAMDRINECEVKDQSNRILIWRIKLRAVKSSLGDDVDYVCEQWRDELEVIRKMGDGGSKRIIFDSSE